MSLLKKAVSMAAVLLLGATAMGSAQAASDARTARADYRGPSEIEAGSAAISLGAITVYNEQVFGPVRFSTRPGERFVSLEIVDESGNAIKGHVEQRVDGRDRLLGHFCGSTSQPMRITPGRDLVVYPGSDPCEEDLSGATQGVVVAHFGR
jgi:hypothetical protein